MAQNRDNPLVALALDANPWLKRPTRSRRSFVPEDYTQLIDATDEIGSAMFGDDWTGRESEVASMPTYRQGVDDDTAQERWDAAVDRLRQLLYRGRIPSVMLTTSGEFQPVPRTHWGRDDARLVFRSGEAGFIDGVVLGLPLWHRGRVLIPTADVLEALSYIPHAGEESERDATHRTAPPTIKAETECEMWLRELAAAQPTPKRRADVQRMAMEKFGPSLSKAGFKRAWDKSAPADWKQPGRKPKRQID